MKVLRLYWIEKNAGEILFKDVSQTFKAFTSGKNLKDLLGKGASFDGIHPADCIAEFFKTWSEETGTVIFFRHV